MDISLLTPDQDTIRIMIDVNLEDSEKLTLLDKILKDLTSSPIKPTHYNNSDKLQEAA